MCNIVVQEHYSKFNLFILSAEVAFKLQFEVSQKES